MSSLPPLPPPPPEAPAPRRPRQLFWVLIALIVIGIVVLVLQGEAGRTLGLNPDELAQFFYLVIILVFVGSALLGRRLGAGEVVRSAAAWLAILLVCIGIYAYRIELSGVGARLLAVLVPGVPVPSQLAGDIGDGSVMVVRAVDGHFTVIANVDQSRLTMMVDTGASFVTLTTTDAARIGVNTEALTYDLPVRTANGVVNTAPITITRMSVGGIERTNIPALVAPTEALNESLLGMSFLNTLHGYTISGDRLILTP